MRPRILLLVLGLCLAAATCGSSDAGQSASDDAGGTRPGLAGEWILTDVSDSAGTWALPDRELTVTFADGQIRGNGSCNSFGGDFTANDDGTLGPLLLSMTEMACVDSELMAFEQRYVGALTAADAWAVGPEGLTLSGPEARLVYRIAPPPEPSPFIGTDWELDTIFAGEGVVRTASTIDRSKPGVTLSVVSGAVVLLSDDCGRMQLPAKFAGDTEGPFEIVAAESGPGCDDPMSNMTSAWNGVAAASGFMINEHRLTFIGLPGETVSFVDTGR